MLLLRRRHLSQRVLARGPLLLLTARAPIPCMPAPTLHKRFDEEACTFEELLRYDRNQFLVCCSTPGQDQMTEGDRPSDAAAGLVPGHAYTLISARRLESGAHSGAQLLKIRNPWGNFEWGG